MLAVKLVGVWSIFELKPLHAASPDVFRLVSDVDPFLSPDFSEFSVRDAPAFDAALVLRGPAADVVKVSSYDFTSQPYNASVHLP